MLTRTRDEWLAVLDEHDVPAGPFNEMPEVFADPQIQHRGMLVEIERPGVRAHCRSSPTRSASRRPPSRATTRRPALGEHTAEVLGRLAGVTEGQLEGLRARGVV